MEEVILDKSDSIESEQRFLDLFGYHSLGPDNSNRFKIFDLDGAEVGFIQRKKLHKKNGKKHLAAVFGYCMEVYSDDVLCSNIRELNSRNFKYFSDKSYQYQFEIRNKNGNMDQVALDMTQYPSLEIHSNDFGVMSFKLDYYNLYLYLRNRMSSFNIEEITTLRTDYIDNPDDYDFNYGYTLNFSKSNEDNDMRELDIECMYSPYQDKDRKKKYVNITSQNRKNGEVIEVVTSTNVVATMEEVIKKHQMGIDSFSYFRHIVNDCYPWNQEIISSMLENSDISIDEFSLFIPDLASSKVKKLNKKKNGNVNK